MGVMDYMENPHKVIEKTLKLATDKILFSFPSDKGFWLGNEKSVIN